MEQKRNIENFRSFFALIREVLIVVAIIMLVVFPPSIKSILDKAGIKSFAGFEFRDELKESQLETLNTIAEVEMLQDSLEVLKDKLEEAISQADDSQTRENLENIKYTIDATSQQAMSVDNNLKSSLIKQDDLLSRISQDTKNLEGWAYLGKVNERKDKWENGQPETILSVKLPIATGTTLTFKTGTYLRSDNQKQKSKAEVVSVVKSGEKVNVLEVEYSHAKGGGWFIWAKVRNQN